MAAPSPDQPVAITMGVTWRFQLQPPPPRPPRLSVAVTVIWAVLALARLVFGAVYFNECPRQPNIPSYLLGLALTALFMAPFMNFPCESYAAQPQEHPKGCKACLLCLMCLFVHIWILAGDVWIFSIYQPNYDPKAADGLYCDKALYTFAFWNAVLETLVFWTHIAKLCKGLLCYVVATPAPTHRDFYGQV